VDYVRSRIFCIPLEDLKVKRAVAAVGLGTFGQRDGHMPLCNVGSRNHKWDDSKDCGEMEMHLVKVSGDEDCRITDK
jgi:hypothetical protein